MSVKAGHSHTVSSTVGDENAQANTLWNSWTYSEQQEVCDIYRNETPAQIASRLSATTDIPAFTAFLSSKCS